MAKFRVTLTVTFSGKPRSEEISQTVTANGKANAVSDFIAGIFSSRKGATVWYREYSKKAFPRGYQKPEKGLLLSSVRGDILAEPDADGYPTNFLHPKIKVEELPDETPSPEPKKKPQQLRLFESNYFAVGSDVEVPPGTPDKSKLRDLGSVPVKEPKIYAIFLRALSTKGLKRIEEMKPEDPSPEEGDAYQGFVNKLRDSDSWILSPEAPATSLPKSAVKSPITISDIRGLTASPRTVDNAYVDGDVAYVEVGDAFSGAPPVMDQQQQQGV